MGLIGCRNQVVGEDVFLDFSSLWSRLLPLTQSFPSSEPAIVTGKNWLHIGSVPFTLTFCFLVLSYCPYIMACLGEPCPSARMSNQNAFVWDPVHLWMAIGRMILTYPLLELAILGDICKINGLFTLCPHLPRLSSIQESGIQTPQDGYFETLVCHFPISQLSEYSHIPCLNTSSLGFIILCVASRVSLD